MFCFFNQIFFQIIVYSFISLKIVLIVCVLTYIKDMETIRKNKININLF